MKIKKAICKAISLPYISIFFLSSALEMCGCEIVCGKLPSGKIQAKHHVTDEAVKVNQLLLGKGVVFLTLTQFFPDI